MSSSQCFDLHSWWTILALSWFLVQSLGLTTDGNLLLSFKHTVISDPLGVFHTWNSRDQTPCSWNGVTCGNSTTANNSTSRVIALSLPNSQLLGSIPPNLGMIQHLQILNLSNNSLYGSIPLSLFRSSQLQMLDLSVNLISGELSELVGGLKNLQLLNLSNNTFVGKIPENLTNLHNLTFVSLKNNYFSGYLPSGFNSVEVLDLSSNLINGSLPSNFTGNKLRYLNISYNRFLGEIPPEFANQIPINSTVDLSFNNLTGEIPETTLFLNQPPKSFSGNPELCGEPLNNLCPSPSSVSTPPNASTPAIAAIPKTINSAPATNPPGSTRNSFKPSTIVEIVVGDILGISILVLIFFYFHQIKKNKSQVTNSKTTKTNYDSSSSSSSSSSSLPESKGIRALVCLPNKTKDSEESSESEEGQKGHDENKTQEKRGSIVMVDGGEREIELEELLKASAYLLGATGSSIMYKAVLEDGTAMAVRRIGEGGLERFRDFENQVRVIAKLVHPNLVRIRGFYWGADEKLVIYEFVPNGNLANARYRKVGSSPCHLPWEVRLKIARGVARGLTYIHDKKHVHGNLKPNNILLGPDMEPKIGDFGLERLVTGESGYKPSGSARNFGSKRSTASRDSFQDATMGVTPSPSPSSLGSISPYYAPESLRSLKPGPKWDVYSFGVILLELLTGNAVVSDELCLEPGELAVEEKHRVLRMADVAIRANLEGKEDALLALFRLGLSCISPVPQKRPPMKEVLNTLEKFPHGHHQ